MKDIERVQEIAAQLMREGHVDNEADATMAAVKIVLATADLLRGDRATASQPAPARKPQQYSV